MISVHECLSWLLHFIAFSIAKMMNHSFSSNAFPSRWKTAKVTPICKGGDAANVNNYRPISVLPLLWKTAKRHVHNVLHSFLSENDLTYNRQSGFRPRGSYRNCLDQGHRRYRI